MIKLMKNLFKGGKKSNILPEPQRFRLRYRNREGQLKSHIISPPIEKHNDGFIAYSFGRGIRKFLNSRIIELTPDK